MSSFIHLVAGRLSLPIKIDSNISKYFAHINMFLLYRGLARYVTQSECTTQMTAFEIGDFLQVSKSAREGNALLLH